MNEIEKILTPTLENASDEELINAHRLLQLTCRKRFIEAFEKACHNLESIGVKIVEKGTYDDDGLTFEDFEFEDGI